MAFLKWIMLIFCVAAFAAAAAAATIELQKLNSEYGSRLSQTEKLEDDYNSKNRYLFLPVIDFHTGFGSEKSLDHPDQSIGEILYLEGKVNLYRGGRDLLLQNKKLVELNKSKLELQENARDLKIKSAKILFEIEALDLINKRNEVEKINNLNQKKMANKKIRGGILGHSELQDFDLKDESIQLMMAQNNLKRGMLIQDLELLYNNKISIEEIRDYVKENLPTKAHEILDLNTEMARMALQEYARSNYPTVDLEYKVGQVTPHRGFFSGIFEHAILLNVSIPIIGNIWSKDTEITLLTAVQKETIDKKNLEQLNLTAKANFNLLTGIISSLESLVLKTIKFKEVTEKEYQRGLRNSSELIAISDKVLELQIKIYETKSELNKIMYEYKLEELK